MNEDQQPPVASVASVDDVGVSDVAEESVLDALEADLAAVEHAIEQLDRVTEQGIGGEDAARQIEVAVPLDRFDLPVS